MATDPNVRARRDDTAEIGQVIDSRYRITSFLGDGGMGSVYRAEHVRLKRPVAVKLLHKDIATQPGFRERFEREALAAGQTHHENCVTVSDFGQLDNGTLFLVMELIEGTSLGDVLDDGPLLPSRALRIARDVLKGLHHAHEAGIVHRDVKPDNIIVNGEGDDERAKILDFGIAKLVGDAAALDDNRDLTQVGTTVGTPKYMPPEQAFGKGVDARSDLYSMSVVLFLMLTGKPPFEADEVIDLLMMHASKPPPSLLEVARGRGFPAALNALVQKGLAKKADQRYSDAKQYIAAIDDLLARMGPSLDAPPRATSSSPVAFDTTAHTPVPVAAGTDHRHTRALTDAPSQTVGVLGAMPSSMPKRYLWIGAGVATAILLIVLLATAGNDDRARIAADEARKGSVASMGPMGSALRDTAASLADKGASKRSKEAATLNQAKKYRQAVQLLEGQASLSGFERYELARARAGSGDDQGALADYLIALELSPALRGRADMRLFARKKMKHKSDKIRLSAVELLARYGDDPDARSLLIDMASTNKKIDVRHNARRLAEDLGLHSSLNLTRSYALDVTQEKTCEDRREALLRLRALEDKRALPVFKQARYRMRGGVMGLGDSNTNKCLKDDAEQAISELGD